MSDTEPPERPTYVLYPLPETPVQERNAQQRRLFRYGNMGAMVFHILCVLLGVVSAAFNISWGEWGTAVISAVAAVFAMNLVVLQWWGNDGVKGRHHFISPAHCSVELEKYERERYDQMADGIALDDIPAARTAEYVRLLDLVRRSHTHLMDVRGKLEEITGEQIGRDMPEEPWAPEFTNGPHVD